MGTLRLLEKKLEQQRAKRQGALGRGQSNEDPEGSELDNDLAACIGRMDEIAETFKNSHGTTAPVPTNKKQVELGSIVTIRKYANEADEKGTVYRFQLVGHGEGDTKGCSSGPNPGLPLISYTCPLGSAVLRKRAGRSYEVNGKDFDLVSIELPNNPKQAANAA
ncbi:MAG: hypothetical protein JWM39_765 [Parcubacteria group bacterium]|nr:hypothetical protein [Parcubacteria group bacterium]